MVLLVGSPWVALAGDGDLRVDYDEAGLTIEAQKVEAKRLLREIASVTAIEITVRSSLDDPVTTSVAFERLPLEEGLREVFETLAQTVPVSHAIYYRGGRLSRITAVFGKGERSATTKGAATVPAVAGQGSPDDPAPGQADAAEEEPQTQLYRLQQELRIQAEIERKYGTAEELIRADIEAELAQHDISEKEERQILQELGFASP